MANSFSNKSLVTFSLAVLVHGTIVLYLVLRIWGCNPLYGKNQHSVNFVVWDFEEICNQVVISCFLLPVLHLKVVIILFGSKQNSTFQCDPGWVRTDMAGPKAAKSPDEGL